MAAITAALVAGALGVCGVLLWQKWSKPAAVTGAPARQTAVLTEQPPAPNTEFPPPVELAYAHFMQEVRQRLGGNLTVGTPVTTPTRIEVSVTAEGKPEIVVVLEKSNTGRQATVIIGPKDAGAVRSYSLARNARGWNIVNFEDLDR